MQEILLGICNLSGSTVRGKPYPNFAEQDTGHAVAIVTDDGVEVLVHVGIDTVDMAGAGFEQLVATGDLVDEGTPLLRVDFAAIRDAGHPTITPVVLLNRESATLEFR